MMNLPQTQYSIKKIVNYTDSIKSFLNFYNGDEKIGDYEENTLGGVLNDVNYTWLSNGSKLVVLNTVSGVKLAAWNFGAVLRDSHTRITCIVGLQSANGRAPLLVVGLQSGHTRGMICIFDITSSKVIRAIQIDKPITSIHVVDDGCGPNLPGVLHPLDGILAIGTVEGRVLLIDLCRQALDEAVVGLNTEYIRDEITACDILPLTTYDIPLLEHHKEVAIRNSQHICIQINEINSTSHFTLKEPTGKIVIRANIVEVKVSALYFCPQLGSLLVGFNFGAIQIYNLLLVKLNYTHLHESITPVSHFAFQEPCDDPRAFCYLWVVYSNIERVENENVENFPLAVMYAISCNTKEFLEGYGTLYQEILSFSNRFQTHLKSLPTSHIRNAVSGHCVSLRAYTKGIVKQNNSVQDVIEDRIALCAVAWTVTNGVQTETFMGLFDLNQWYKEQMPTSVKFNENPESYILFMPVLSEISNTNTNLKSSIIDVKIDSKTIMQFSTAQRLEEHYFPSALAFKLICTRVDDIVWIQTPGVQRYILSLIELAGPLCLLRPSDIFNNSLTYGLTPLFCDSLYNENTPVHTQREMILSIALEHQLISWLCHCAQEWSNGSQSSSGCTLEFFLSWAWQRANVLKTNVTNLCHCLFDHSGMRLDSNAHILFNHSTRQIKNLVSLYSNVINNCSRYLFNNDYQEIQEQYKTLQMVSIYFEVLQWLLNVGLLPECPLHMYPRMNEPDRISAPYPIDSLVRFYQDRREILFELQGERQIEPTKSCDLLFIDNLIDLQCNGNVLHAEWQQDGGTGLYPPPSLQSCLRTYLVDHIDIVYKHSIFIYLFLDLAMTLDQNHYSHVITHLIKFPAVFKLSPSIIKITQAFWQLDHGDFSTAMSQLLDPLVSNEDLHQWHHRVAVKSLLAQGQHQHALLYHQVRKPPMLDLQDLCITITLLIVNDLLQEAFHFQRQHRSDCNEKELLQHFMEACDKTNQLVNILQLPLSEIEEQALMKYLEVNRREDTENLMVIYYLHRSRYAEALNNNEKLNNKVRITQGLIGQQNLNFRNEIITDYREKLPDVTKKLLDFCMSKENVSTWKSISKPLPMSVYIHDSQEKTKYKSSLIQSSLQTIKEAWNHPQSKILPFISTPKLQSRRSYSSTPKIYPTNVHSNLDADDDGPTPNKVRRISPRQPIGNLFKESEKTERPRRRIIVSASSLLSTPIVKRKVVRHIVSARKTFENMNVGTPQSILKVRKLMKRSTSPIRRGESTTPENLEEIENDLLPVDKNSAEMIRSSYINLANYSISTPVTTPRKSVERTPKQVVRFVDLHPSSTSSDGTIVDDEEQNFVSKNTTMSDDVFYSPTETKSKSSEQNSPSKEIVIPIMIETTKDHENDSLDRDRLYILQTPESNRKRKLNDSSVQARRSYKSELADTSMVSNTSSLFSLSSLETTFDQSAPATETPEEQSGESQNVSDTPTKRFPKVSSRKSLTRKVLEQNTFAKALSTPRMQTRLALSKQSDKNVVGVEITHSEKMTSIVRETGDKTIEESKTEANMEVKNMFSTETDPTTLEQTIKHQHNESFNKSSMKLREVMEDLSAIDPVLTSDSDVDESVLMKYYNDKETSNVISTDSIFSIDESLDNEYDAQDDLIEEFPFVEERRDEEKIPEQPDKENQKNCENQNLEKAGSSNVQMEPFEITDDLSDEDVEFNFQSSMEIQNAENPENVGDNIVEMQDMEPENYIEPDFEEEVGNVLSEDSNVDDNNKDTGNTDGAIQIDFANENSSDIEKYAQEVIEEQENTDEDEEYKGSEPEKYSDEERRNEDDSDEERVSNTEDSEEDAVEQVSDETSDEEKESSEESLSNPPDQVIQIDSSSEDEMELKLSHEENSLSSEVDVFEKNISFEPESDDSNKTESSDGSKNKQRTEASDSQCSLDSKASTLIRVSEEKDDIPDEENREENLIDVRFGSKTNNNDENISVEPSEALQKEIQVQEFNMEETPVEQMETVESTEKMGGSENVAEKIVLESKEIRTETVEKITVEQTEEVAKPTEHLEVVVEPLEKPSEQIETVESTEKMGGSENVAEPTETTDVMEEIVESIEIVETIKEGTVQGKESVSKDKPECIPGSASETNESVFKPESKENKIKSNEDDSKDDKKAQKVVLRRGRSSSIQKDDEGLEKSEVIEERTESPSKRKPSNEKIITKDIIEKETEKDNKSEEKLPSSKIDEDNDDDEESLLHRINKLRQSKIKESLSESVPKRMTRRQSVQMEEQSETGNRQDLETSVGTPGKKTEEKTSVRQTRRSSVPPEDVEVPTRRTRQGSVQPEESVTPMRRTRRSSVQTEDSDTPMKRTRQGSVQPEELDTSMRRTRRSSVQPEESDTPMRRTRQGSVQPEESDTPTRRTRQGSVQPEGSNTPVRRTRQGSVQPEESDTPMRRTRQGSVQREEVTPARVTRRSSIQSDDVEITPARRGRKPSTESIETKRPRGRPPSIKSEQIEKNKSGPSSIISDDTPSTPKRRTRKVSEGSLSTPILETIEEYTSTHRLTRRQKDMIEKTMKIQEMKKLENIDPIQLMEKESYDGPEDPDEKLIQYSPASSVKTESSVGTRSSIRLRESSRGSTPKPIRDSLESPEKDSENEGRTKRRSFTLAQQALSSPKLVKKRRLSNVSDTSEGSSIVSMPAVVLEKFNLNDIENLRHRSLSPTLLSKEQDASMSSKLKLKRKGKTSILPPIVEITNSTDESGTSEIAKGAPLKRGRPKKIKS